MSLPKHNPLLRGLYFLMIIMMFVFMSLLIRVYWPDSFEPVSQLNEQNVQTIESAATTDDLIQKPLTLHSHPSVRIVGLQKEIALTQNVSRQMERVWLEFSRLNWEQWLKSASSSYSIYVSYQDYDASRQTVRLTIGMSLNQLRYVPQQLIQQSLPGGEFYLTQSVLDTWSNLGSLPLAYNNDFEVVEIDSNYRIVSQVAYLSLSK